ncbi:hypothetical protein IFM89_019064, partial [Coptis chinensis]
MVNQYLPECYCSWLNERGSKPLFLAINLAAVGTEHPIITSGLGPAMLYASPWSSLQISDHTWKSYLTPFALQVLFDLCQGKLNSCMTKKHCTRITCT